MLNFSNFLAKDLSVSLANMIAMVREAILVFSEWFGSSSNLAVLLQGISKFLKEDFSEAIDTISGRIDELVAMFKDWVDEAGLLYQALEGIAYILSFLGDIIADFQNGGINDDWFDRINIPGLPPPLDSRKVNDVPSKTVNMLSGLSPVGLGAVHGSNMNNTTNITYNVRTTKDISLRSAERERRLYSR